MLDSDKLQEIKQRFGIIGNAEGLNRAIEHAYTIAPTDSSLLVLGESGVGKEFFPQIIHAYSSRKHNRYLAINCGAIPEGTIDSELFGHVKGSFTGATSDHKGYFETANGGTIFLDEVGELPLETQVRLLRVLETGEYMRVGSSEVQKTNVRVVAATNLNLQEAIDSGRFRADLYYRLFTITIQVPSLRERKEDIPLLFRKFASDCTNRYQMPAVRLTDEAKGMLMNYYFRGNIRQLKGIAERICLLEKSREITPEILRQYLPAEEACKSIALHPSTHADYSTEREILYKLLAEMKHELDELKHTVAELTATGNIHNAPRSSHSTTRIAHPSSLTSHPTSLSPQESLLSPHDPSLNTEDFQPAEEVRVEEVKAEEDTAFVTLQDFERESIRKALERHNGNRKAACKELGISERTLYRKIKEYNL